MTKASASRIARRMELKANMPKIEDLCQSHMESLMFAPVGQLAMREVVDAHMWQQCGKDARSFVRMSHALSDALSAQNEKF